MTDLLGKSETKHIEKPNTKHLENKDTKKLEMSETRAKKIKHLIGVITNGVLMEVIQTLASTQPLVKF